MPVFDDELRQFGRFLHYGGVLVAVICATVLYSFVHTPAIDRTADTSARIEELKILSKNAAIMREQHQKVSEKLQHVQARIDDIQRRVPQNADAGEFLKEVTQLASAEHLALKDFTPQAPANRNGYAEMQITLAGNGSYASICRFVDRLSKLQRLSKVKDLRVTAEGGTNEYPMTATLVIYFGLRGKESSDAKSPQEVRRG